MILSRIKNVFRTGTFLVMPLLCFLWLKKLLYNLLFVWSSYRTNSRCRRAGAGWKEQCRTFDHLKIVLTADNNSDTERERGEEGTKHAGICGHSGSRGCFLNHVTSRMRPRNASIMRPFRIRPRTYLSRRSDSLISQRVDMFWWREDDAFFVSILITLIIMDTLDINAEQMVGDSTPHSP